MLGDELLVPAARLAGSCGVWDRLHEMLLARLRAADRIDWSCVVVDSSSICAVGSAQKLDPIRLCRGKARWTRKLDCYVLLMK